jgi:hypothetical protein
LTQSIRHHVFPASTRFSPHCILRDTSLCLRNARATFRFPLNFFIWIRCNSLKVPMASCPANLQLPGGERFAPRRPFTHLESGSDPSQRLPRTATGRSPAGHRSLLYRRSIRPLNLLHAETKATPAESLALARLFPIATVRAKNI